MPLVSLLRRKKKRHKVCADDIPSASSSVKSFVADSDIGEEPQDLWLNNILVFNDTQEGSKTSKAKSEGSKTQSNVQKKNIDEGVKDFGEREKEGNKEPKANNEEWKEIENEANADKEGTKENSEEKKESRIEKEKNKDYLEKRRSKSEVNVAKGKTGEAKEGRRKGRNEKGKSKEEAQNTNEEMRNVEVNEAHEDGPSEKTTTSTNTDYAATSTDSLQSLDQAKAILDNARQYAVYGVVACAVVALIVLKLRK